MKMYPITIVAVLLLAGLPSVGLAGDEAAVRKFVSGLSNALVNRDAVAIDDQSTSGTQTYLSDVGDICPKNDGIIGHRQCFFEKRLQGPLKGMSLKLTTDSVRFLSVNKAFVFMTYEARKGSTSFKKPVFGIAWNMLSDTGTKAWRWVLLSPGLPAIESAKVSSGLLDGTEWVIGKGDRATFNAPDNVPGVPLAPVYFNVLGFERGFFYSAAPNARAAVYSAQKAGDKIIWSSRPTSFVDSDHVFVWNGEVSGNTMSVTCAEVFLPTGQQKAYDLVDPKTGKAVGQLSWTAVKSR